MAPARSQQKLRYWLFICVGGELGLSQKSTSMGSSINSDGWRWIKRLITFFCNEHLADTINSALRFDSASKILQQRLHCPRQSRKPSLWTVAKANAAKDRGASNAVRQSAYLGGFCAAKSPLLIKTFVLRVHWHQLRSKAHVF